MTTKEYLGQISRYDLMIENKLSELYRIKQMAVNISAPVNSDRVQTSGSKDKICESITKIVDLEREIDAIIDEYVEKKRKIVSQIDSMQDNSYYSVLTDKYVNKMEFKDIFLKMKVSDRTMYSIYGRALKEFENLYGETYLDK